MPLLGAPVPPVPGKPRIGTNQRTAANGGQGRPTNGLRISGANERATDFGGQRTGYGFRGPTNGLQISGANERATDFGANERATDFGCQRTGYGFRRLTTQHMSEQDNKNTHSFTTHNKTREHNTREDKTKQDRTKHHNTGRSCTSCLGNLGQTTTATEDELCYDCFVSHAYWSLAG